MLKQPTEYLDSLETMMALRATKSKLAFAPPFSGGFLDNLLLLAGESVAALAFPPLDAPN